MTLAVIIPAHNPDLGRLRRAFSGLCSQTLSREQWEIVLVDNASMKCLRPEVLTDLGSVNVRIIREPQLGLTWARRRGFLETQADFIVLLDDDNALAPDYLTHVVRLFAEHPCVGALGGKILPEFEIEPTPWTREFFALMACRDYGDSPMVSNGLWDENLGRNAYPLCAPVGAGMALRRQAIQPWLAASATNGLSDRRGAELSSGGDNDIVFVLMKHGWKVGYFPELSLTHLIPAGRLDCQYLARLNRGIQKSWMQVLTKHDANPWPPIPAWTVPLRNIKAWFVYRAWSGPAAYIRWKGACGHFEGRAL